MARKQEIILTIGSGKHSKRLSDKIDSKRFKIIHIDERDRTDEARAKSPDVLFAECDNLLMGVKSSPKAVIAFGRASVADSVKNIAECCERLSKKFHPAGAMFICPSLKGAKIFNDKFKTYQALKKTGVNLPKTIRVTPKNIRRIKIKYPAVLKTTDLTGGCGMTLVRSKKDFLEKYQEFKDKGIKNIIIADFLDGMEISYAVLRLGDRFIRLPASYRQPTDKLLTHPDSKVKITGLLKGDIKAYETIEQLMIKYNIQGLMYLEGVMDKGKTFKYLEGGTRISGSMPIRTASLVGFNYYQTLIDYIGGKHFSLNYPRRICAQYSTFIHHGGQDARKLEKYNWILEAKYEDLSELKFSNNTGRRIRISFILGNGIEQKKRFKIIRKITGNAAYKRDILSFASYLERQYSWLPVAKKILDGKWGNNLSWRFYLSDIMPDKELTTAVFAIPMYNNRVAFTKTSRGWELPGGHIETGENAEETLLRETKEEIGVDLANYRFIGFRQIISQKPEVNKNGGCYPYPISYIVYYAGSIKQKPKNPAGKDALAAKLFSFKELNLEKFNSVRIIRLLNKLHEI